MEEEEHDKLSELTEIIFYEMPKLEKQVQDYLSGKTDLKTLPDDKNLKTPGNFDGKASFIDLGASLKYTF